MNHIRLHAPATADLRDQRALFRQGGAFNALAHTAEMRRPESGAGRYNIPEHRHLSVAAASRCG